MCITEFDEEKYKRTIAEASWEEGRAQGMMQGMMQGMERGRAEGMMQGRAEGMVQGANDLLFSLVRDSLLPTQEAAKRANMTEAAFLAAMESQFPAS